MSDRIARILWTMTFGVLVALAIPWFLWGKSTTFWGFPVWLWWHIGWMVLAAILFGCFARRGWDLFIRERNDG